MELQPNGPKFIVGDLNGPVEAFPTLMAMMAEEGWSDIGADPMKCEGIRPGVFALGQACSAAWEGALLSLL